jgi:NAD(P)-dependent dehydrogenase (short-subunit alcohol dehydrogenase family)
MGSARSALVTGANSGIGKAAAVGLAKAGFDVTLVVRNPERGEAARKEVVAAAPSAAVELLQIDLASQRSIREGAAKWLASHERLDVLVNSAGVFLKDRAETADGVEKTMATNYLAYFLMAHEFLPALRRAAPSRIVNVASRYGSVKIDFDDMMVKTRPWSYLKAVPPTMVMRVLFTQELAQRLEAERITVNAVHPGLVRGTQLLQEVGGIFNLVVVLFGKSPAKGADTVVWLATAPEAADETGKLWSKRKPLATPGQGSDPAARKRLWQESLRLTGVADWP